MKKNIHPQYFNDAKVICTCGNTFITGSTKQTIYVEVCHKCHPFYTGEKRYIDTLGQVEKFQQKQKIAADYQTKYPKKKAKEQRVKEQPKSLRELLQGL